MKDQIKKLNQLVADMSVLYVKLHNYHWNVEGINFFQIHDLTEQLYYRVAVLYDDLAERVLQLGEKPISTLAKSLEYSRIKEEEKSSFSGEEVLKGIIKDFKFLKEEFSELSKLSKDDKTTEAYADGVVAELEKQLWMIKSTLR